MIEKDEFKSLKKVWYSDALSMFFRLSAWVVVPVVLASLLGNYLDDKYNTDPWILIVCVGLSFVFTMIVLVKETLKSFREIEASNDSNKEIKYERRK